ncbi:YbaB/EbfC family nucleoid-associated protein [Nonomuraea insulae]|uniref:YbaB/EbfC family nucleoid-associated protein n=1 Tax=Nonomuraea insulae TaxID=1616787 RepID=A0ABW1CMN2_9ACTN
MAAEVNQQIARIRETCTEFAAIEHTSRSKDGLVSVTVGAHGRLCGVELNPRVYRTLSPSELAEAIMRQAEQASAAVTEQSKELMTPLMPEGTLVDEIFGGTATLDAFLPGPVEPAP